MIIRRFLNVIFFLVASGFFLFQLEKHHHDIVGLNWGFMQWLVLAVSTLLWILVIAVGGMVWWLLLAAQGLNVSMWRIQNVYLISQFGKYLPGNVGQHVSRLYALKSDGASVAAVAHTLFLEALIGLGVGGLLALIALSYFLPSTSLRFEGITAWSLAFVALLALVLPWLFPYLLNRWVPSLGRRLGGGIFFKPLKFRYGLSVVSLFLLTFLLSGCMLEIQLNGIFGISSGSVPQLTCMFALIWIVGYLAPGAPAGLGVREALMLLVFGPIYGQSVAVGLSVALRLATTLGDLSAFLFGLGLRFFWFRKS